MIIKTLYLADEGIRDNIGIDAIIDTSNFNSKNKFRCSGLYRDFKRSLVE